MGWLRTQWSWSELKPGTLNHKIISTNHFSTPSPPDEIFNYIIITYFHLENGMHAHDVVAAIFLFQNNEMVATLLSKPMWEFNSFLMLIWLLEMCVHMLYSL